MHELRKQVLERLIDEELLFQEAKKLKMLVGKDVVDAEIEKARSQFPTPEAFKEALAQNKLTEEGLRTVFSRNLSIQAFVEKDIAKGVAVSDAEVHDFYTGNKDKFESPEQAHARHILVAVDEKADEKTRQAGKAKADDLLAQLKGGANFEELAKKNSDCPSAPQGGDLGFFGHGQMVPEFDSAAFALKPGELSGVVATKFGYHIIKLEEKKDAGHGPGARGGAEDPGVPHVAEDRRRGRAEAQVAAGEGQDRTGDEALAWPGTEGDRHDGRWGRGGAGHPAIVSAAARSVCRRGLHRARRRARPSTSQKRERVSYTEHDPAGAPIRFAVGAMLIPEAGNALYRALLEEVESRLGRPIKIVDRESYAAINRSLKEGEIDAAFVCSGPYVDGKRDFGLQLLAAPVAYGRTTYNAYVIVREESPARRFEDLRGKSFAFTDPDSNTGHLVPAHLLATMGETPERYFSRVIFSGSHDASIAAVATKIVDAASVDSLIWEYARRVKPEHAAKTRIIWTSPAYGIPPVVVRPGLDPELVKRLAAIFLSFDADEKGRSILRKMMLDRFVEARDADYDSIRAMQAALAKRPADRPGPPRGAPRVREAAHEARRRHDPARRPARRGPDLPAAQHPRGPPGEGAAAAGGLHRQIRRRQQRETDPDREHRRAAAARGGEPAGRGGHLVRLRPGRRRGGDGRTRSATPFPPGCSRSMPRLRMALPASASSPPGWGRSTTSRSASATAPWARISAACASASWATSIDQGVAAVLYNGAGITVVCLLFFGAVALWADLKITRNIEALSEGTQAPSGSAISTTASP